MSYQLDDDGFPYPTKEVVETRDVCINCHGIIFYDYTYKDEWAHWHGGKHCRSDRGFSLDTVATPPMHPEGAVL